MVKPKAPAAVLLASADDTEAQFYEALQQGDIERLMALWSDDDEIVCVHPGGLRVMGAAAIRASFEAIFANGTLPVQPARVRRLEGPGCAVHSVLERIDATTAEGTQTAWVMATNVYLKTALGWRLAAHHASAGLPHDTPEQHDNPTTLH
ncbi:MAG: YybH family protein [Aquincola tertiaricarbonis]|uniref:YybH family protein n=1 Tax=Aquincola TaxID=391952 RepID=UPI000614C786|nr:MULTISPECIES: nuclear transport factor 2 family protein [Aquincola]MCR5866025.1 nuclear transport factor 2 family protein [Aquincola sp. J276]